MVEEAAPAKGAHIVRKRAAARVRWPSVREGARDREGARERCCGWLDRGLGPPSGIQDAARQHDARRRRPPIHRGLETKREAGAAGSDRDATGKRGFYIHTPIYTTAPEHNATKHNQPTG